MTGPKTDRLKKLASFIEALERRGVYKFKISVFYNRLRLQKYVFIAKYFGVVDFGYPYNMYLHGPYSPALADDYYELANAGKDWKMYVDDKYLEEIEKKKEFEEFVKFVENRDGKWLEVAATILGFWESVMKYVRLGVIKKEELEEKVKKLTKNRKPFATSRMIDEVFEDLKLYKLLNTT